MRWLWFVAALLCFAVVFKTPSIGLAVVCLLAALAFILIGTVAVASSRIDSRSRDATALLGPEELRRMREIEEKRIAGTAANSGAVPMIATGAVLMSDPSTAHSRAGGHEGRGDTGATFRHDGFGDNDGGGDGGGGGD